jgi:anti-sigma factor ChrR (cupin superfamily)
MITEHQHDQASLYALGALPETERPAFEAELSANADLRELVRGFQQAADALALAAPPMELPGGLKSKVLARIDASVAARAEQAARLQPESIAGLAFMLGAATKDWKPLPVPGTYIKLLSLEPERGYAVLMGKLDPGARYPAHINAGPEDFYILTGDLHIGDTELKAGDFHHADGGSQHEENFSIGGCTLLAVLTTDDPLVAFAMAGPL